MNSAYCAGQGMPDIETLYAQYHQRIYLQVFYITRCPQAAEDITQEVFMKCWMKIDRLSLMQNWKGYLSKMSRNHALTYLQKKKVEKDLTTSLSKYQDTTFLPSYGAATELQQVISKAISQLPPQQQLVYRLRREQGLRRHEIAEQLKISPDTVRGTLQKALRSIKKYLHSFYGNSYASIIDG